MIGRIPTAELSLIGGLTMEKTGLAWMDWKIGQQRRLYKRYGKPLEAKHTGEWVAISEDGETLLGEREGEVLVLALDRFGRDDFALVMVGHEVIDL